MAKEEIEIAILPNGKLEIRSRNPKGPKCVDAVAWLKDIGRVEKEERTSDFYAKDAEINTDINIR